MVLRIFCALACLLAAASYPAAAQEPRFKEAPLGVLIDLSETLGAAHAIRTICNGDSDQTWRNFMFTMLNMEGPSGSPRRAALTSAFNRGFRSQSAQSRTCTPELSRLEAQIAARGRMLAESVADSYLQ